IEDRALGRRIDPAEGDRHDLGARGDQCLLHLIERAEASGADDQPRAPRPAPKLERLPGPTLNRGQHLHLLAVPKRRRLPLAPGHNLAVDRDATPRSARRGARRLDRGGDRGVLGQRPLLSVHLDRHVASTAEGAGRSENRSGEKGSRSTGGRSPARSAAMLSAVIGAWSTPFREWPVAISSPEAAGPPITGAVSGVPGRSPPPGSSSASSA